MSGRRGNVEAPPVWWGYCCRVGLSPVALRGLRGRWFCILSKSRIDAQHGGRFRLLSGGAGAGSLRDGLPWAVGRRVRHIMTWAGNLHRWPRRSSLPPLLPSSGLSHRIAPGAGAGLDWIGCTVSSWAWLVCWPGLAGGRVAGWGWCGSGGGLSAPLLLRRSCSPAGLPLCLYGRGLLRAAVWPCSCWPAAWRCRLRWAGWALGWHDPAGLVGWGQAVPVRHTAQFCALYFVTFHPSLSG